MRLIRKTLIGKIDKSGNLNVSIDVLKDFCSLHRDRGVIIRAEILSKEPSERTRNYFFGYIVSEMQGILLREYGERYTKEQTYDWIRRKCPFFIEETREEGKWKVRLREFEELDQAEAGEAIDFIIQYVAENLYQVLDYPI